MLLNPMPKSEFPSEAMVLAASAGHIDNVLINQKSVRDNPLQAASATPVQHGSFPKLGLWSRV